MKVSAHYPKYYLNFYPGGLTNHNERTIATFLWDFKFKTNILECTFPSALNIFNLKSSKKFVKRGNFVEKDTMSSIYMIRCFFLFILSTPIHVHGWDISLEVTQPASNGIGGEVFAIQPVIGIFNRAQTQKYIDIEGRVVASLSHANYKDEKLGIARSDGCDTETYGQEISFDVIGGDVNFSGLCINRSGTGYKITYTLFDEFNIVLSDAVQSNLSIEVGEPFTLGVVQHPTGCQGGETWKLNPIVAIQDRGHNTVKSVNDGNVSEHQIIWQRRFKHKT